MGYIDVAERAARAVTQSRAEYKQKDDEGEQPSS